MNEIVQSYFIVQLCRVTSLIVNLILYDSFRAYTRRKEKKGVTYNQLKTIQTSNTSDFKSYWGPHSQGLVPFMFSD